MVDYLSQFFVIAGVPISIWLALFTSIYLTYRLKFVNVTMFVQSFGMFSSNKDNTTNNANTIQVSPLKSFFVQTASTLGIGSIAGSVFALYYGGPGVVVWIMIFSFGFGIIKFCEVVLGYLYRNVDNKDVVDGGMFYVFKKAFVGTRFAKYATVLSLFSAVGTCVVVSTWSGLQLSQIIGVLFDGKSVFSPDTMEICVLPAIFSVVVVCIVFSILVGGIVRTGWLTSFMVPSMVLTYLFITAVVFVVKSDRVSLIFSQIFTLAFDFHAIAASGFVLMIVSMQRLFLSTEAGIGTCSIAASATNVKHVARQAFLSFVDVFTVSTVMSLGVVVLLLMDIDFTSSSVVGVHLIKQSFDQIHPIIGSIFVFVVFCFCFTTLTGNGYVVQRTIKFLFKKTSVSVASGLYITIVLLAGIFGGKELIYFIDRVTYFLLVPHLCLLILLSGKVRTQLDIFLESEKEKKLSNT